MSGLTDLELWARVDDDPEAFATLFERHANAVYNFCFRRTADWALAEELVSRAFLETWRRRSQIAITSRSGSLLPWLLSVATNLIRNERRSRRRLARALARLNPREHERDFSSESDDRVDDERQMKTILGVIDALPPHEVEVLTMYAWGGLSYDEIAVVLNVPVGTVRSRLARARASLRELVGARGHEISSAEL